MSARNRSHQGFTLVEILIVVVILGILAAIVIPQFTNASETARASSVVTQLQSIRSQLELYQVQHNGEYPTLAQMQNGADDWGVLINRTNLAGEIGGTDATAATHPFGPYLKKAPVNPFINSSTVAAAAAAGVGWTYDATNGEVKAVVPATLDTAALGLSDKDVVAISN